jgi:ribosomal protein L37AE/L43A
MSQFTDPAGYNKADAEFHERDEQLIRDLRAKLDVTRQKTHADQSKNPHWMKCPKCGGNLKEIDHKNVKIDQCGGCGGVFFDAGELALLMGHDQKNRSTMDKLFGWLPG